MVSQCLIHAKIFARNRDLSIWSARFFSYNICSSCILPCLLVRPPSRGRGELCSCATANKGRGSRAMSPASFGPTRILAVAPRSRGFGFIMMEDQTTPIDWDVRSCRGTAVDAEIAIFTKVRDLVDNYRPGRIILEKPDTKSRRGDRVRLLLETIQNLAIWEKVKVRGISANQVRKVFNTFRAHTKQEIAIAVALQLPELAPDLPPERELWNTEHHRMPIFEAAALALTFFYSSAMGKSV